METRAADRVRLNDGRAVYVEPMAFARAGNLAILAGEPMYVWSNRDTTFSPQAVHGLLGVALTAGGVEPLLKPDVPGIVTHVRLLADGRDFAAVFAVTDSSAAGGYDEQVLSYWFARTDGRTWRELEKLPMPAGALDARRATDLIRSADELLVAIPYGPTARENVAIYTHSRRGWRMDTLAVPQASYLALAEIGGQAMLFVVHPDYAAITDSNSLWVFVRVGSSWQARGLVIRGGRRPVFAPTISGDTANRMLSWIAEDTTGGPSTLHAASLHATGRIGQVHIVARNVVYWDVIRNPTMHPQWVADARATDGTKQLMFVEWIDGRPVTRDVIANPYTGLIIGAPIAGDASVVGPVFDPAASREQLVSGILRSAKRCGSAPREAP